MVLEEEEEEVVLEEEEEEEEEEVVLEEEVEVEEEEEEPCDIITTPCVWKEQSVLKDFDGNIYDPISFQRIANIHNS